MPRCWHESACFTSAPEVALVLFTSDQVVSSHVEKRASDDGSAIGCDRQHTWWIVNAHTHQGARELLAVQGDFKRERSDPGRGSQTADFLSGEIKRARAGMRIDNKRMELGSPETASQVLYDSQADDTNADEGSAQHGAACWTQLSKDHIRDESEAQRRMMP